MWRGWDSHDFHSDSDVTANGDAYTYVASQLDYNPNLDRRHRKDC